MKHKSISTFFISVLICGCSVKPNIYTSIAHEESHSVSVKTDFKIIKGSQKDLRYPTFFGVIAAKDNDAQKYTLIAPSWNTKKTTPMTLDGYQLYYSVPLSNKNTHELVSKIGQSIKDWNVKYTRLNGKDISFRIKLRTKQFVFHYQNSFSGPLAMISIHTGRENTYANMPNSVIHEKSFTFEMNEMVQLDGFKELLELSLKEESF